MVSNCEVKANDHGLYDEVQLAREFAQQSTDYRAKTFAYQYGGTQD